MMTSWCLMNEQLWLQQLIVHILWDDAIWGSIWTQHLSWSGCFKQCFVFNDQHEYEQGIVGYMQNPGKDMRESVLELCEICPISEKELHNNEKRNAEYLREGSQIALTVKRVVWWKYHLLVKLARHTSIHHFCHFLSFHYWETNGHPQFYYKIMPLGLPTPSTRLCQW